MNVFKFILIGLLAVSFSTATAEPKWKGKLVKDNVTAEERLKICGQKQKIDAFTPGYEAERLYVTGVQDFDAKKAGVKDAILSDQNMTEADKEKALNDLDAKAVWVVNGYLVFHLRLFEAKILKMQDFKFVMTTPAGEQITELAFILRNKQYITGDRFNILMYNHFWVLKFTRPFTKANFPEKVYTCRVIFPNGQDVVYEVRPQ